MAHKKQYNYNWKQINIDDIYKMYKEGKSESEIYSIERIRQLLKDWYTIDNILRLKKTVIFNKDSYALYLKNRKTTDKPLIFYSARSRFYEYWLESLYNDSRDFMLRTKHKRTISENRKKQLIRWAEAYNFNWNSARIVAANLWITTNNLRYAISFYKKTFDL